MAVSSTASMSMGTPAPGLSWLAGAGDTKLTVGIPMSGTTENEMGALVTVTPPEPVAVAVTVTVLPAEPYGSGSSTWYGAVASMNEVVPLRPLTVNETDVTPMSSTAAALTTANRPSVSAAPSRGRVMVTVGGASARTATCTSALCVS